MASLECGKPKHTPTHTRRRRLFEVGIDASAGQAILEHRRARLTCMNPREKRTTTQPGLGQVSVDPRSTAVRARGAADKKLEQSGGEATEGPASGGPISGAPISGAPPSARHTRAIESSPLVGAANVPKRLDTKPVDTKALAEPDRISTTPSGGRDRRAPTIREEATDWREVGRPPESRRLPAAETPRSPGVEERPAGRPLRPIEGRPVDGTRPVSRPLDNRVPQSEAMARSPSRAGARAPEGKPVSTKPSGGRAMSSRPPVSRPPVSRPPVSRSPASSPIPGKMARLGGASRRSIREDDVGAAVSNVADAVGAPGRQVPRIVRTKAEVAAAPIDHRAGFLLAHIDGVTNVQGLVDIAAMPENEVWEILERLRRLGIVAIR